MTDFSMDKILYPESSSKDTKFPIWVHATARITLILANCYLVFWLWVNYYYFFSFGAAVILIYQITILFFGQQIRELVIRMI